MLPKNGEMAEWLKAHAWKACLGETLTWVRIPLSPPVSSLASLELQSSATIRIVAPRFAILNPCPKRWSELSGGGRARFCPDCQTHVHALDQYSDQEFVALRAASSGRVCGYLSGEPTVQPRTRRAIIVGAMLTAISPLMAQTGRLRIRVTDATGAALAGMAEVSLLSNDGTATSRARTNEIGEVRFEDLPIGDIRILVTCEGFISLSLTRTLLNTDESTLVVPLKVGAAIMGGAVSADAPFAAILSRPREETIHPPTSTPPKKRRRWWPFR